MLLHRGDRKPPTRCNRADLHRAKRIQLNPFCAILMEERTRARDGSLNPVRNAEILPLGFQNWAVCGACFADFDCCADKNINKIAGLQGEIPIFRAGARRASWLRPAVAQLHGGAEGAGWGAADPVFHRGRHAVATARQTCPKATPRPRDCRCALSVRSDTCKSPPDELS